MKVSYTFYGLTSSSYVVFNNVIWVRVTGEKIMIECQDGRRIEVRHRKITDFEVIHA